MDKESFQIAFWVVSITLVLCGLCVTVFGWHITGEKAKALAKKKDIHDSIDASRKALIEFEDCSYAFWLEESSGIQPYKIVTLHRRMVSSLSLLGELRDMPIPSTAVMRLRRNATLDLESASRPISQEDEKIKKISKAITDIMGSDLLKKTWVELRRTV